MSDKEQQDVCGVCRHASFLICKVGITAAFTPGLWKEELTAECYSVNRLCDCCLCCPLSLLIFPNEVTSPVLLFFSSFLSFFSPNLELLLGFLS